MFLIAEARTDNEYWDDHPDAAVVEITDSLVIRINEAISWLKEGHRRFGTSLNNISFFWYGCEWLNTLYEVDEILNHQELAEGMMIDTAPPDDMYEGMRVEIGYLNFSLSGDGTRPEVQFKAIAKHQDDAVFTSYILVDKILNPESVMKVDWVAGHSQLVHEDDDGGESEEADA